MEALVETVNKRAEVTGSVFGRIERMISAAQAGLETAQNRIDRNRPVLPPILPIVLYPPHFKFWHSIVTDNLEAIGQ